MFVGCAEEALGVGGEGGAEGGKCGFLVGEGGGSDLRRMLDEGVKRKGVLVLVGVDGQEHTVIVSSHQ